jgi:HPt (histidine-containing phosphotransfer) domain-containing protein
MNNEPTDAPTIDMQSITQLAEGDGLGQKFVAEIIDLFLADLGERVSKISVQMNLGDYDPIAPMAHAIKGSCGHFRAMRLMDLASELEDKVRTKHTKGLQAASDAMVAQAERVRAALEAYKSEHLPQ